MPSAGLGLGGIRDTRDLATALGVSHRHLTFVLYRLGETGKYRSFSIPKKSGGHREISAPRAAIGRLQSMLRPLLDRAYRRRGPVHGFVVGHGILSNARQHHGSRWVLNVDIEDFFSTITFPRIRGMLMSKPYLVPEQVATFIAHLCCHNGRLATGSPISPVVSNMLCARLDRELGLLASRHRCTYTRYADDLTFSTTRRAFPLSLCTWDGIASTAGDELIAVIERNGFRLKPTKTRLQPFYRRQSVTGLTVNERPNVTRTYVRTLRAMIHRERQMRANGREPTSDESQSATRVIRGKLEFLRQIRGTRDSVYLRYAEKFRSIDLSYRPTETVASMTETKDVFICHASEDKETFAKPIAVALTRVGVSYWLDDNEIRWGDGIASSINSGLKKARVVLVLLSVHFIAKRWAQKELFSQINVETSEGTSTVLPLILAESEADRRLIREALPLMSDKRYLVWADLGPDHAATVASELKRRLDEG